MPCYNSPVVKIVYPPGCDPTPVPVISSDQVHYDGPNLPCTGVQNGDCLNTALEKIDAKICSQELVASIIQTIANDDVLKAYFCQLVSECGPIPTTTTSTTATPTTTTTSSSSSTTTTSSSTSTTTTAAPTTTTTTTTISALCNDFVLDFGYSFTDANNTLNIIFDGYTTIPAGFYQDAFCNCCDIYTTIEISDGVGGSFETGLLNIPNLIYANTPYTKTDLSGTFNEYTDEYTVTVTNCITNGEVSCTKVTSQVIPNPVSRCPEFTVTPDGTSIDFGFTPSPGLGATYYVNLRNGDTNAIISTQTFTSPLSPVASSFTGLTIGANYKVQLELFTSLFGLDNCTTVDITPL